MIVPVSNNNITSKKHTHTHNTNDHQIQKTKTKDKMINPLKVQKKHTKQNTKDKNKLITSTRTKKYQKQNTTQPSGCPGRDKYDLYIDDLEQRIMKGIGPYGSVQTSPEPSSDTDRFTTVYFEDSDENQIPTIYDFKV